MCGHYVQEELLEKLEQCGALDELQVVDLGLAQTSDQWVSSPSKWLGEHGSQYEQPVEYGQKVKEYEWDHDDDEPAFKKRVHVAAVTTAEFAREHFLFRVEREQEHDHVKSE